MRSNYATTSDYYYKDMTEDFELVGGQTPTWVSLWIPMPTCLPLQPVASIRLSNTVHELREGHGANAYVTTANIIGAGATALQGKMMTTAPTVWPLFALPYPSTRLTLKAMTMFQLSAWL